jgi:predicted dienelactone hydrolase
MDAPLELTAGHPLEVQLYPIGRRTVIVADAARAGRLLAVEIWYPAATDEPARTKYELFPGIAFGSAGAQHEPPARPGKYPLVLFSHGSTGMRFVAAMLCEALAARGAIVVSSDHPGDALVDWLTGAQSEARANEVDRVADAHLVLDTMLHGRPEVPVDIANAIDHERIVLAGHSYGAYTAFATAAGSRGVAAHPHVRAIVAFQPYTRTMSDALLGRIDVPTLLIVGTADTTTPPEVDADRPWALLRTTPVWRLDLEGAGHQACTDVALYAELARHIVGLPQIVLDYLTVTAQGTAKVGTRTWRQLLQVQVEAAWAFLHVVLGIDAEVGVAAAERLEDAVGLVLRRR